jgi:hypothetical protein
MMSSMGDAFDLNDWHKQHGCCPKIQRLHTFVTGRWILDTIEQSKMKQCKYMIRKRSSTQTVGIKTIYEWQMLQRGVSSFENNILFQIILYSFVGK